MSTVARIAKNTAALAVGNIITKFFSLAFIVYVARELGDVGFGRFSTAMALVGLVGVLPNYVARPYLLRETARRRAEAGKILDQVTLTNIVLALAVLGALALIAPHLGYHPDTVYAILLLAFALIFDAIANSYHAALAGFERMELSALVNVINTVLTVAFGAAVLLLGYGLLPLVGAYLAAKALTLVFARRALRAVAVDASVGFDPALMKSLLLGSWPFFVTTVFVILYARLDIVMLSFFREEEAVGYYNAAYKLMEGMGLLASSFVTAVYPVLSRLFMDAPDRLSVVYRRSLRYLLAFVLPAAAGLTLIAPDMMPALFGANFGPAAVVLMILVWGQALDCINPLLAQTLRATDREKTVAFITGLGAVFNGLTNLALIPLFGMYGAAATTVASFALVYFISQRVLVKSVGPARLWGPLARTTLAPAAMAAAMLAVRYFLLSGVGGGWRTAILLVVGGGVYPLAAWGCRVLDEADRRLLADIVRKKMRRNKEAT